MPAQSDLRLGDPDYFNTNQIGNLCAFAILFAQYLMRRKDGKWGFVILLLILTLLRSLSKTTLAAFLVSEVYLVIKDRSMSRKTKMFLVGAAALLILAFWGLFESYYDVYTTAGNQVETLTGRTAIWAYALNAALEKPWFGNGFDSIWKVFPPFGNEQFEARHAENELLQQFYAYGIAGVVILAGLYGSLWLRIRKLQQGSLKMIFGCIVLYVVARGFAEAESFDLLLPLWAIVLIAALVDYEASTEIESEVVLPGVCSESSGVPQPL
jgi:O-antigen ligase